MRWTRENLAKVAALNLSCKDHPADEPAGYSERWDWSRRMYVTCLQVRCPECGLYKCWVPRELFK